MQRSCQTRTRMHSWTVMSIRATERCKSRKKSSLKSFLSLSRGSEIFSLRTPLYCKYITGPVQRSRYLAARLLVEFIHLHNIGCSPLSPHRLLPYLISGPVAKLRRVPRYSLFAKFCPMRSAKNVNGQSVHHAPSSRHPLLSELLALLNIRTAAGGHTSSPRCAYKQPSCRKDKTNNGG